MSETACWSIHAKPIKLQTKRLADKALLKLCGIMPWSGRSALALPGRNRRNTGLCGRSL